MSERVKTLVGALLALFVIYALFFNSTDQSNRVTRPVSTEQGLNGYYALDQWLIGEGINTYSLRERYPRLTGNAEIPRETGNILITTLPYHESARDVEITAVHDWIDSGNTLLVLAALNDTPDWATYWLIEDLETVTGIIFNSVKEQPDDPPAEDSLASSSDEPAAEADEDDEQVDLLLFDNTGEEQEYEIAPRRGHPLMAGVDAMQGVSQFVSSVWRAKSDDELILELAMMQLTDSPVVWQRKFGDGQIVIVGSGTLLTNRMIASADNRRFVANLIRGHLAPSATVIFDDLHQGLSSLYDPAAFYADARLHYSIYFIIGFWLLYVVGASNRLLDTPSETKPLRQSEFLEAVGGFINRHMPETAVGLWMYQSWFNDLRRHMGLQLNGEPVWQELNNMTILDTAHLGKMQRQYDRLISKRTVNLIELHNTLHKARKAIG